MFSCDVVVRCFNESFIDGYFVYTLEDDLGDIVYVGITGNVDGRYRVHKQDKEFSLMKLMKCPSSVAKRVEKLMIFDLAPKYNSMIGGSNKLENRRLYLSGFIDDSVMHLTSDVRNLRSKLLIDRAKLRKRYGNQDN